MLFVVFMVTYDCKCFVSFPQAHVSRCVIGCVFGVL